MCNTCTCCGKPIKIAKSQDESNYEILNHLKNDCENFLMNSNSNASYLSEGSVRNQISKMKDLWNTFSDDMKPQWLTYQQILDYERRMDGKAMSSYF